MSTPIAVVAGTGLAGAAAWLGAAALLVRARERREASWAGTLLGMAILAGWLGFRQPEWHVVATGLAAGLALRNLVVQKGAARALTIAGLVAWIASVGLAFAVFR